MKRFEYWFGRRSNVSVVLGGAVIGSACSQAVLYLAFGIKI